MMTNDNDLHPERQYDTLEQALVARSVLRAPRNTVTKVLARIATLPQQAPPAITPVRYAPPVALPLPELDEEGWRLPRRGVKVIFMASWVSLCLLFTYLLVWPALSNFLLGGSNDFEIVQSLIQLWAELITTGSAVFNAIAPLLPSLYSATVGLAIMLLIFGLQRRRLGTG
ncbi:MAG: hypothetical protein WCS37_15160 [Chloroflexota bacterium]|nr:hypothetical protein [Chloroflexota bacterium]